MVYILKADNKYKVGRSKNPASRLKQLQTGNPIPLEMVALFEPEDDIILERKLHGKLNQTIPGRQKHLEGEWFELSDTWLNVIIFETRTKLL